MSKDEHFEFSSNELQAIYSALNVYIIDLEDFLADPNVTIPNKIAANENLKHSKTALEGLTRFLNAHGALPRPQ